MCEKIKIVIGLRSGEEINNNIIHIYHSLSFIVKSVILLLYGMAHK